MPLVLDASVALSFCLADEFDEYAVRILHRMGSDSALVPSLWFFEVANGLLIAERRGRVSAPDLAAARELLSGLSLHRDDLGIEGLSSVLDLARSSRLSAYDAAYLELALREGLPLATRDGRLREAAAGAGVPLAE